MKSLKLELKLNSSKIMLLSIFVPAVGGLSYVK